MNYGLRTVISPEVAQSDKLGDMSAVGRIIRDAFKYKLEEDNIDVSSGFAIEVYVKGLDAKDLKAIAEEKK